MAEQYKKFWHKSLWVVLGVFCIRCVIAKLIFDSKFSAYDLYGFAGESVGLTAVVMMLYEKYLWKLPIFFFEKTPVLGKEYTGVLKSTYDDVERKMKLKIKQTLLSVSVIMETGESRSRTISASIEKVNQEWQLSYIYLNEPKVAVRERSEIHYGTATFSLEDTTAIEGKYYTDRNTAGDMELTVNRKGKINGK